MCVVLELCQHQPEPPAAAATSASSAGEEASPTTGGPSWWERDPRAKAARGPPSTLVQMVCGGEDADVRCATSEYKLSIGMAAASRCSTAVSYCGSGLSNAKMDDGRSNGDTAATSNHNDKAAAASGQRFQPPPLLLVPQPLPQQTPLEAGAETETSETTGSTSSKTRSKLREMATTVAESGTMARTILSGFTKPQRKPKGEPVVPTTEEPLVFQGPPTNPREALSAARAATAGVRSFSTGIKVDVGGRGNGGAEAEAGRVPWAPGGGAGGGSSDIVSGWRAQTAAPKGGDPTGGDGGGAGMVDTSASARIVNALREDTLWAESLPDFIRKTMEAQKGGFGRQVALK